MTKTKEAAPELAQPDRKTFKLRKPLDGGKLTELTVDEPTYGDVCRAVREHPKNLSEQTIHMIAACAGKTRDVIAGMFIRDARDIESWLARLDAAAVLADRETLDLDAYECTFRLSVPVPTDKKPIEELTLRAPDLGGSVAAESGKSDQERTAKLIAALADTTLQVVYRLRRRDVARMEAWFGPLVSDSDSPTE